MTRHPSDASRSAEPRFVVRELDGFPIRQYGAVRLSGRSRPQLSCSVLDSAFNFEEVARFNAEDVRPPNVTYDARREIVRNRAAGLAAILNGAE